MTRSEIGQLRLRAQHIGGDLFGTPEAVAKHMLAMQAQDYTGALWAVGLRTKDCTQKDIESAIRDHKIVRTWPMRGTLHMMHADDVHWLVDLLAPRATAAAKSRRINQLGLTDSVVDEAEAVLRAVLKGGKSILRGDVVTVLQQGVKGIAITNQHTQHLMRNFGERGIICFGPHEGKQPTFVLLDEWVPEPPAKARPEALGELAKRYFTSHGPATLKDFSGWGMLTVGDAKAGLAVAEPKLQKTEVDGVVYYYAPGLQPLVTGETFLLPGFDEYLLGYKDRSAILAAEHANKVVPGGNGMFLPTIVKDGQVVGLWKRTLNKASVKFSYRGFDTELVPAIASEKRYQEFVLG